MTRSKGVWLGLLAIAGFSLTLPMTRLAVPAFGPLFVGIGRTATAGLLALLWLMLRREAFPRRDMLPLATASFCGVVVYPLLTATALRFVPAMHGAVVVGFLPAATAVFAVIRCGERPSRSFWLACGLGGAAVFAFAIVKGGGTVSPADLLLVVAALFCGYGYAEGARITRRMAGWRVVCWGQVFMLPLTLPTTIVSFLHGGVPHTTSFAAWFAFGDLVLVSALFGFFVWYTALNLGGTARIGQLQLVQLPLSCIWSALLLGEHLDLATVLAGAAVVASAAAAMATRRAGHLTAGSRVAARTVA